MLPPLHSVRAGFDDLIGVVFVLAIIVSRIIGALRKDRKRAEELAAPGERPVVAPPAPVRPPGEDELNVPGRELREFLESLARGSDVPVPPSPPPVPRPPAPVVLVPRPTAAGRHAGESRAAARAEQRADRRRTAPSVTPPPPPPLASAPAPSIPVPTAVLPPPEQLPALAYALAPTLPAPPPGVSRARLLMQLRTPDSVREAVVLREILGPPIGLRGW